MAENRRRFPLYLHMAIGGLSVILGCFGVLGYCVYGEGVNQIVTESFPSGVLIQLVRCMLCVAVLLTYPLQIFPVIEIVEGWLFNSWRTNNKNSCEEVQDGVKSGALSNQTSTTTSASESYRLLEPNVKLPKSKVCIPKQTKSGQTFLCCIYILY